MPFPFLSDQWVDEARRIRGQSTAGLQPIAQAVRMNLFVTEVPHPPGSIDAHLDTSDGRLDLERDHLDGPDLTVTIDYETAKALFVGGDMQAVMAAFMAGKIRVDGDMSKLLALQGNGSSDEARELAARIRAITE
jgi:hypothetical protein